MVLPAYSVALALIALLGYMAVAAGVKAMPEYAAGFKSFGNNFAVPALFLHMFPGWFAGLAFAAIAIGALVPASIMAIACGNLFTRNIFKEFIAPDCTPQTRSRMAKLVAFVAKLGALFFVLELQTTYAIQLQLLGGIWICQTVPAVLLALYVRLDPTRAAGRLGGGHGAGTWMVVELGFKSSTYPLHLFGRDRALLCRGERAGAESAGELAADAGLARQRHRARRDGGGRLRVIPRPCGLSRASETSTATNRCGPRLAEATGDVLLGSLVIRRGEDLFRRAIFDQLAQIHEGGVVARRGWPAAYCG